MANSFLVCEALHEVGTQLALARMRPRSKNSDSGKFDRAIPKVFYIDFDRLIVFNLKNRAAAGRRPVPT